MFKTDPVPARRAARCAFGVVMAAGGVTLFVRAWTSGQAGLDAEHWLAMTWLASLVAGAIAYGLARMSPRPIALSTSLVLPWIGLALVGPLSASWLEGLLLGSTWTTSQFDEWAALTCKVAIVPHIVLAVLASFRMERLARGDVPMAMDITSIAAIYGVVTGAGALPFVIPAVFVAITGIPFIPLFLLTNRIAASERERVSDTLPVAHAA